MRSANSSVGPGAGDDAVDRAAPTLSVNGTLKSLDPGATVEELVAAWCSSREGVAVARNREVVPRSEWSVTSLEEGDVVEIVSAAAGG